MENNEHNELVERARNADLSEYFKSAGYDVEQRRDELHIKGYGGLFVNTNDNSWYCFSENKGGTNSVNCLTDILGMDFKSAVEELAGRSVTYHRAKQTAVSFSAEKKELSLPERDDNMKKVFAYLCKTRGISAELVSQLAHDKLLYQDKKGNAVFLHKDESGKIIGAEIQGTNSEKRFKGVAPGTSESVFSLKIGEPQKCYIFESAIDLLSFKQLANPEKLRNAVLVSMAGLKPNALKNISASGMKMYSCVDNDEAGRDFTARNMLVPCRKILEENGVKDWNELLQKNAVPEKKIEKTAPPKSHARR